jgi:hypothetical protein
MERQSRKVTVFEAERYDGDWPPDDATGFIAWFQAQLDKVPAEHRGNVRIELDSVSGYEDSHYVSIEISYWRPETDSEMESRITEARRRHAQQVANLEFQLKRLKGE